MLPSEDFGIVPKVGLEIEIVQWTERTRGQVCQDLINAELMSARGNFVREYHRYHCECSVCEAWADGKVPWPIQTVQQYDASLPDTGGEFITSPLLVTDLFLDGLEEVWNIVVRDAQWRADVPNRRGGPSSPSIHVHVSVENPFKEVFSSRLAHEAIWDFLPELFTVASVCGLDRGIDYRKPDRAAGHHSAVNIRQMGYGVDSLEEGASIPRRGGRDAAAIRLEWRMWEAAYTDWPYVKGAVVLSAAFTQLVANRDMAKLFSASAALFNEDDGDRVDDCESTEAILDMFSDKRFSFLCEMLPQAPLIQEDPVMYDALSHLLNRVKESDG